MRKKGYTLILTTAMILTLSIPMIKGDAANVPVTEKEHIEEVAPTYEGINDVRVTLNISGTTAQMQARVNSPSSKKVSLKMILQRKDGGSWTKVTSWVKTGMGSQTLSKNMTVTRGKTYRMKCVINVGSEEIIKKTPAKTA